MLIVRIWEGLGNQLFQYAYARALNIYTGLPVYLETEKPYEDLYGFARSHNYIKRSYALDALKIKLEKQRIAELPGYFFLEQKNQLQKTVFSLSKAGLWPCRFIEQVSPYRYDPRLLKLKGSYYIKGWFQNERYFSDIRSLLLKEIFPENKIKVSAALSQIIKDDKSVSIHIRRGDYVRSNNALTDQYYGEAIRFMKKKLGPCVFLVFTDDPAWAAQNLPADENIYFLHEMAALDDYEELFLMSRCAHHIIANSTFSWWAAWLNKNPGKVIAAPRFWWRGCKESGSILPGDWHKI